VGVVGRTTGVGAGAQAVMAKRSNSIKVIFRIAIEIKRRAERIPTRQNFRIDLTIFKNQSDLENLFSVLRERIIHALCTFLRRAFRIRRFEIRAGLAGKDRRDHILDDRARALPRR
jgi:hypothetical protein